MTPFDRSGWGLTDRKWFVHLEIADRRSVVTLHMTTKFKKNKNKILSRSPNKSKH